MPFAVTLPPFALVEMDAAVLTPSVDGFALFTVTHMEFSTRQDPVSATEMGRNVLGTQLDILKDYKFFIERTSNLTSFMQVQCGAIYDSNFRQDLQ